MKLPSIALRSEGPSQSSAHTAAGDSSEVLPRAHSQGRTPIGYFRLLWRAEMPLPGVLWHDMLTIGTIVNIAAGLAAFLLFAVDGPAPLGVAIFLAPVPYNVLLFLAVWRAASREPAPRSLYPRIIAAAWLMLAFAI